MAPKTAPAPWRSRIVGTGEEAPDQLVANPRNWRTHPGPQRDALRGSLDSVGWVQQVMVNRVTGHVVDGHARVEEALSRGEATVPVLYVELDADEEALVLATLDPIGAMAQRDDDRLRALLADIGDHDAGLDALLASLTPEMPVVGLTDPDAVPEVADDGGVKRGDIYALGDHRLMCGDSTAGGDVALLMDGVLADAVFTSPPYLQQRDYEGTMAPDWNALMCGVFHAAALDPTAQVFVNLGPVHRDGRVVRYWDAWIADMEANGWPLFGWYVWDKLNGMPGDWNGRLAPAHEYIFHFAIEHRQPTKTVKTKHVGEHPDAGMRKRDGSIGGWAHAGRPVQPAKIPDSVVRMSPQMGGVDGHVAPFPVALPQTFIDAYPCQRWLDPFMGAGTTFIAAEQAGRIAYGMEIVPRYVAVSIRRWEEFTGRKAVKVA